MPSVCLLGVLVFSNACSKVGWAYLLFHLVREGAVALADPPPTSVFRVHALVVHNAPAIPRNRLHAIQIFWFIKSFIFKLFANTFTNNVIRILKTFLAKLFLRLISSFQLLWTHACQPKFRFPTSQQLFAPAPWLRGWNTFVPPVS